MAGGRHEWLVTGAYATAQDVMKDFLLPINCRRRSLQPTELAGVSRPPILPGAQASRRATCSAIWPGTAMPAGFRAETAVIMLIQLVSAGGESTAGLLGKLSA